MQGEAEKSPIADDVNEFLREFKAILTYQPHACDWIGRRGYDAGLPGLSLTQCQAETLIRDELDPHHLVRGPEPDDHHPESACVCMFRLPITADECDAYIKLSLRLIRNRGGQLRAVIWSFKSWTPQDDRPNPA